jgi:hypothetical protein
VADNGNTSLAADSTGTPLEAAGRGNVEEEVETCIPEEAGSRRSKEAADTGNVEVGTAYSILAVEAGRRIFEVVADRSILGLADSKRLAFQLVDSGIWARTLPSEAPRIINSRLER